MILLDGKACAERLRNEAVQQVEELKKQGVEPRLAVVLVGDDPASASYVKYKHKDCKLCGIVSDDYRLPQDCAEEELLGLIGRLNEDAQVHGILVQLPLPKHMDEERILNSIDPRKDVDGFHPNNLGKLMRFLPGLRACTPWGIMRLFKEYNCELDGKHAVVVGRSNIVGKPMALMLLEKNATVSIAHSHTHNLKELCKSADILVCATGKPKFFTDEYVKEGAIVVDVGMNRDEEGGLCGDVDVQAVVDKVSALTPVPGGVGPMTRAQLMLNTVQAARQQTCS